MPTKITRHIKVGRTNNPILNFKTTPQRMADSNGPQFWNFFQFYSKTIEAIPNATQNIKINISWLKAELTLREFRQFFFIRFFWLTF